MPRSKTRKYKNRMRKGRKTMRGGGVTSSEHERIQNARDFWNKGATVKPVVKNERSSLKLLQKIKTHERRSNFTVSKKGLPVPPSYMSLEAPSQYIENPVVKEPVITRSEQLRRIKEKREEAKNVRAEEDRLLQKYLSVIDNLSEVDVRAAIIEVKNPKSSIKEVIKASEKSLTGSQLTRELNELVNHQKELLVKEFPLSKKKRDGLIRRLLNKLKGNKNKQTNKKNQPPVLYGGTRKNK